MTQPWMRTTLGLVGLAYATLALAEAPVEQPLWVWIDAGGAETRSSATATKVRAHPSARVIWHVRSQGDAACRATTLDVDGQPIAQFEFSADCWRLTPDVSGAAWVWGRIQPDPPGSGELRWMLYQFAADGTLLDSVDLSQFEQLGDAKVLPHALGTDVVITPKAGFSDLVVLRKPLNGPFLAPAFIAVGMNEAGFAIKDHRHHADGRLDLLLTRRFDWMCAPLQPCPREPSLVLRLSAERGDLQRFDFGYPYGWYVDQGLDERLDAAGRVWRMFYDYGVGPSIELMQDGPGPVARIDLAETPTYLDPLGYVGNTVLLDTYQGAQLTRYDGALLAYRPDAIEFEWWSLRADSDWGFLMQRALDEHHYDATLLHPQTLQDRVHFDLDGRQGTWQEVGLGGWSVLPDGWAYASAYIEEGGQTLQGVAAFAVPGSPAARPFASGFE